jgi:hypothetical protein
VDNVFVLSSLAGLATQWEGTAKKNNAGSLMDSASDLTALFYD